MKNKKTKTVDPHRFDVTVDVPCIKCGKLMMIFADTGICMPCEHKKNQNKA
jgi:hypothetical protein